MSISQITALEQSFEILVREHAGIFKLVVKEISLLPFQLHSQPGIHELFPRQGLTNHYLLAKKLNHNLSCVNWYRSVFFDKGIQTLASVQLPSVKTVLELTPAYYTSIVKNIVRIKIQVSVVRL